jgi:type IV pilus assembly protein PilQ
VTPSTRCPILGDIPGLGVLFRSKSRTDNKDELLIFVTPKILREGANLY